MNTIITILLIKYILSMVGKIFKLNVRSKKRLKRISNGKMLLS